MLPKLTLVIGGARSGKSQFAEGLVLSHANAPMYLASAEILDEEMRTRVEKHRNNRIAKGWTTVEEPFDAASILTTPGKADAVLFDCATLWLSNHMLSGANLDDRTEELLAAVQRAPCPIVVVTNEVGLGIVPDQKLARAFRDAQGTLNQLIAAKSDLVVSLIAGIPMTVKGSLPKVAS